MSTAARVRAFLAANPDSTTGQVIAALGPSDATAARQILGTMRRDGMVAQDKSGWPYTYRLIREAMTHEERQARFQDGNARARTARSQQAQERRAQLRATRVATQTARAAQTLAERAEQSAARKRQYAAVNLKPSPDPIRFESITEWMKRTGQQPERLPHNAVSPANQLKGRYA